MAEPGILVVDPSPFFREAIGTSLGAAGHRVRTAADWDEAAAALDDADLALLVLDLGKGRTGLDALRALRAARPAVRAIALSPPGDHDRVIEALRAGACDHLPKPLHDETLQLSVERALGAWRTERERDHLLAERAAVPAAEAAGTPEEADRDLELARALCAAVTSGRDPGQAVPDLLDAVAARWEAAPVALFRCEPGGADLVREAERDGGRRGDRERLPPDCGLSGACLATGVFVAAADPARDPRFDPAVDTPEDGAPGPLVCLPLRIRGRVLGVVRAFPPLGAAPTLRSAEVASAALSAAMRSVLLYRSWLSGVEEVARIRREARAARAPASPPPRTPEPR